MCKYDAVSRICRKAEFLPVHYSFTPWIRRAIQHVIISKNIPNLLSQKNLTNDFMGWPIRCLSFKCTDCWLRTSIVILRASGVIGDRPQEEGSVFIFFFFFVVSTHKPTEHLNTRLNFKQKQHYAKSNVVRAHSCRKSGSLFVYRMYRRS